jgi:TPR repeat protein
MSEYANFIKWRLAISLMFVLAMLSVHLAGCALPVVGGISAAAEKEERDKWMPQAKAGNAEAQYRVANTYCCGRGEFYDTDLAIAWYCRAALQGHTYAQYKLANIFAGDLSIKSEIRTVGMKFEDPAKAYAWYSVAASQGNIEAMKKKEKWESKLDSTQREEAQHIIKNWNQQPCPPLNE